MASNAAKHVRNYDDNTDVNTTIDAQAAGNPRWFMCIGGAAGIAF